MRHPLELKTESLLQGVETNFSVCDSIISSPLRRVLDDGVVVLNINAVRRVLDDGVVVLNINAVSKARPNEKYLCTSLGGSMMDCISAEMCEMW
ncbi:hypothetical protein QE152_g7840 [Popillia japonica]|uniref:Uncharacterized protein n=1 Tax=Popillia japonica TaxID=7064 RepID=A0AAW1MDW9_POPJA